MLLDTLLELAGKEVVLICTLPTVCTFPIKGKLKRKRNYVFLVSHPFGCVKFHISHVTSVDASGIKVTLNNWRALLESELQGLVNTFVTVYGFNLRFAGNLKYTSDGMFFVRRPGTGNFIQIDPGDIDHINFKNIYLASYKNQDRET